MTNAVATSERRFDHVVRIIDAVSKIVFLIGGLFAAQQYWTALAHQRVERTVGYLQRYEDGNVADARHRIDANLRTYLVQFREMQSVGITSEDRDKFVISMVENDKTLPDDIDRVADFFEGLSACIDERLCDGAVADRYFAKSGTEILWNNFQPYVMYRRKNSASYAAGLERFSKKTQVDPH